MSWWTQVSCCKLYFKSSWLTLSILRVSNLKMFGQKISNIILQNTKNQQYVRRMVLNKFNLFEWSLIRILSKDHLVQSNKTAPQESAASSLEDGGTSTAVKFSCQIKEKLFPVINLQAHLNLTGSTPSHKSSQIFTYIFPSLEDGDTSTAVKFSCQIKEKLFPVMNLQAHLSNLHLNLTGSTPSHKFSKFRKLEYKRTQSNSRLNLTEDLSDKSM